MSDPDPYFKKKDFPPTELDWLPAPQEGQLVHLWMLDCIEAIARHVDYRLDEIAELFHEKQSERDG